MKTKIVKKCQCEEPERQFINPPYTVFGHTAIPKSFQITMKVAGLKKMLKELDDDDTFRIEIFAEPGGHEFSFIKNSKKQN